MAKTTKKTAKRKGKKRASGSRKQRLLPWILACNILLLFFLTLAGAAYFVFLHPWGARAPSPETEQLQADRPITITATGKKKVVAGLSPRTAPSSSGNGKTAAGSRPRIAILIDDMGHDAEIGRAFLDLPMDLSFAFLPLAPHSRQLSLEAGRAGREILLHLPLEAEDPGNDPGPGTLFVAMDRTSMQATFLDDLKRIPMASGVNNHMGSKFTADRQAMQYLLELIGRQDLFFVDSVTTPASVGYELAESQGLRTARRQVFLDHQPDRRHIDEQLDRLLDLARQRGDAIAIGHPRPATLEALRDHAPRLAAEVTVVPIHELTK